MTQTLVDISKISDRVVAYAIDQLAASIQGGAYISLVADGSRPASTTPGGFAFTSNYTGQSEVDFWNTKNNSTSGFSFYQKTADASELLLSALYGDATFSEIDVYVGTVATFLTSLTANGGVGTTNNHPFIIYTHNIAAATFDTSQRMEAADANAKVATGTLTKNLNVTLAVVPGLSIPLLAGKTYLVRGYLSGVSGAGGGLKVAPVAVGGLTATSCRFNAYAWANTTAVSNTTATSLGSNIVAANAIYSDVYIEGSIVVGVAGTLEIHAAQNTSNGTDTTVLLGSTLSVTRIN